MGGSVPREQRVGRQAILGEDSQGKWLRVGLVESAQAAARTKGTYLAAQYARIKGRHGHKKAIVIVAVAHSILVIAYHLLQRRVVYCRSPVVMT